MISKFKTQAVALMASAAFTIDKAFAMAQPWNPGNGHNPPPGNTPSAPELDGTGAIAAFALLVSIALVLINRSRNK